MTDEIRIEYTMAPAPTLEGMLLAGQDLLRPHVVMQNLLGLIALILVAAGGAAVVFAIGVLTTGAAEPAIHYVWIGALLGMLFFLFSQRWVPGRMAHATVNSAYAKGPQWARFDPVGATFGNGLADWRTDWPAIDCIKLGKRSLVLRVAGIAFIIPREAIHDPQKLYEKLNSWKDAG